MHGIVHKTLEEYVTARTDEDTWETIADRADVEPTLYLPVSTYDDSEIDAVLAALSSMATQDRPAIERDFGRTLAPELLSTFDAHVRSDWDLFELLENLESLVAAVDDATDEIDLPAVAGRREAADGVRVTYRPHRETVYCSLGHGILEGIADAYETDATVAKRACVRDGDDACAYRVERR